MGASPQARRVWLRRVGSVVLFGLLAVAITWPLATQLDRVIPLGTEEVATVPLVSLWSLWWNVDRLSVGYQDYWDSPIFHPHPGTFAFSETHALNGLVVATLQPIAGSLVAAYNLLLLATLTLNGWVGYRLLRVVEAGEFPALVGGGLLLTLPLVHQELGVLATVPIWGVLASLLASVRFVRRPGLLAGLYLGLALGATFLLSGYLGLATAIVLALTLPFLVWRRWRDADLWRGAACVALGSSILVLPIALPQRAVVSEYDFERSAATIEKHSAEPAEYLESAWHSWAPAPKGEAKRPSERAFWPGTVGLGLALVALVGRRRWTLYLAAVGVLGFLMSLGPNGAFAGLSLHGLLEGLPGYGQMRSLFRFAVYPQICVSLLAAIGLDLLWQRASGRLWRSWWVGVALLAFVHDLPKMGELQPLPSLDTELGWLRWIEEEIAPETPIAFFPFPEGRSSLDYLGAAQWMFWQMRHGRPMVNGYSSFFPPGFSKLKKDLNTFPAEASLTALEELGVRHCVVHRGLVPAGTEGESKGDWVLERVASDDAFAIDIYRIGRTGD